MNELTCECGADQFVRLFRMDLDRPGAELEIDDTATETYNRDAAQHIQCARCRTIYAILSGAYVVVSRAADDLPERQRDV